MKGHRYFILSLCSFMLALVFVLPPIHLPPTPAGAPILAGTSAPNSIVYLPLIANQYNPHDIPMYWNTFEDITDPAAIGITSDHGNTSSDTNTNIKVVTENVDYAGGKQALEVSGTLPGAQYSYLAADVSVKKLIGEDTLDLSNKTIGFSLFIPKDSPTPIYIDILFNKGDKYVKLSNPLQVSDPHANSLKQGVWVDYQGFVKKAYQDGSWSWTNGSEAEARDVIQHCERFWIGISRSTAGASSEAKFYLDDLNWIGIDILNVPVDNNVDSLRKYAANKHFKFGLFTQSTRIFGDVGPGTGDPWYAYKAVQEGDVNTLPGFFSPKQNEDYSVFDYDRPEDAKIIQQAQFGEAYHMTIMGYGIGALYGPGTPQWIQDLSFPDATKALLLYHIEKDVRYTQGKNVIWYLFNEAAHGPIYNAGLNNRQMTGNQYSPWAANATDSSLIKAAFIKAREVDPNATLMMNDCFNEVIHNNDSDFYYQFVSDLKAQGVPIDGVGFEMHNYIDPSGKIFMSQRDTSPTQYYLEDMDTWLNNVDLNVKRYASQGLKVAFSEVEGQIKIDDIDLTTPAGKAEYESRLQWQAKYYAGLLKIALENDNVILFHIWGVTDRFQGVTVLDFPGYGDSWIFDKHYQPKPAYDAMLDLLKGP